MLALSTNVYVGDASRSLALSLLSKPSRLSHILGSDCTQEKDPASSVNGQISVHYDHNPRANIQLHCFDQEIFSSMTTMPKDTKKAPESPPNTHKAADGAPF